MRVRRSIAIVALASAVACGSNQAPTAPGSGTTVLYIQGTILLTAIGQTSQLAALAALSNGTLKDVTREAIWTSADASVASISFPGLLAAVRFGTSRIEVPYAVHACDVVDGINQVRR